MHTTARRGIKDKILGLYFDEEGVRTGKSYNDIARILNCSKGTISHHINPATRKKTYARTVELRKTIEGKVMFKFALFKSRKHSGAVAREIKGKWERNFYFKMVYFKKNGKDMKENINAKQILKKFSKDGKTTRCYLTGKKIDLSDTSSYHFDHVVAVAKGGTNGIDNLGIAIPEANCGKGVLSVDEFIDLCKDVLTHNGYKVTK
jgi:hypothetical protein